MGQILSETIFRSYSDCVAVKSTSVKDDKNSWQTERGNDMFCRYLDAFIQGNSIEIY